MIILIRFLGGPKNGQIRELSCDEGGWPVVDILEAAMTPDGQVYDVDEVARGRCQATGTVFVVCTAVLR